MPYVEEEELTAKITETTARGETELNKQAYVLKANAERINQLGDDSIKLRDAAQELKTELTIKSSSKRSAQKKQLRQKNEEMRRYLSELEKNASTGRNTNSQLTSKVLKFNKELADLKVTPKQIELAGAKGAYTRALTENKGNKAGLEQLKSEQARLGMEKDRLLANQREREVKDRSKTQSLENSKLQLEAALSRLNGQLRHISTPTSPIGKSDLFKLQQRLNEVEAELEECRKEAMTSREEVSRVYSEIENYARILEAMEDKLAEAENRTKSAEKRKSEMVSQMEDVRQRYIAIIASSK